MPEADRPGKSRGRAPSHQADNRNPPSQSPLSPAAAPSWLSSPIAAPFAIGGVQRKVAIGQSNDRYEREADQMASRVAGGGRVPFRAISPLTPAPVSGVGQRQTKPDEKKKDEKSTSTVQRAAKPEDREKDPHSAAAHLQRQAKPEDKKKEERASSSPVQRQTKPDQKKKDEKPAAVQRAAKPGEKKKEENSGPAAVQRDATAEEKKKSDKPGPPPVQRQAKSDDKKKDEKPASVQRQSKPDEKKKGDQPAAPTTQRKIRSEDKKKEEVPGTLPVQRAEDQGEHKETTEPVQTSRAAGGAVAPSMENAAAHAISSKGPGEPLNPTTQSTLESRMGTDLSDVRVHNDSSAHSTAEELNARAFTHQSDIWLARGESQHNLSLMAHEATHVVQQTGSVHRQLVQRAPAPPSGAPPVTAPTPQVPLSTPAGDIDLNAKKMLLPELKIPAFKANFLPSLGYLTIQKGGEERPTGVESQREIWKDQLSKKAEPAAEKKLETLPGIRKAKPEAQVAEIAEETKDPNRILFLYITGSKDSYLIGTPAELKSEFTIPRWDQTGAARALDVDHKQELQLGGKNDITNMWLLDASSNRSSGSRISKQVRDTIDRAVNPHVGKDPWPKKPDTNLLRQEFEITYKTVKGETSLDPPNKDKKWEREEVEQAELPVNKLHALGAKEVVDKHLLGKPNELALYPLSGGGRKKGIHWDVKKPSRDFPKSEVVSAGFKGLHDGHISYELGNGGAITGNVHKREKGTKILKEHPVTLPLREVGGLPFTVTMDKGGLLQAMRYAELNELSPVEFNEVTLGDERGIVARGKFKPSIPIFKKLNVDILIEGDDVSFSKTFTKDDFTFPGPVQVPEAALTVSAGTAGISVQGVVLLEIQGLGKGKIAAGAGSKGLELTGSFDFDTTLFDPANVHLEYKAGKFSGGGAIGIKSGKVKGIKSANITASFEDDKFDAKGSIVPDIPAVEQADLSMSYSKEAGLVIGGDLSIKKDTPGISGGSVHVVLSKPPGADKFKVKASGEATPNIPGISAKLAVSYDDGLFDAVATAGYEKGMLKGSVTVGVTNRPVTDGNPSGEPPPKADKITIYGGGSVTLKIAPWLQATATIVLKPDGEVVVTGEIGLPSVLDIFPEKKLDKNIFKIAIDIPIVGVSVLGHNIGIFASIGGGLDLSAGIGPGQLQELKLAVTYNPSHEEETHVSGGAKLHIPAHAGLRLFVRGALGVGIPIVDAEAGLEVGGQLGLEGALDAGVQVDWTPQKGLVLDASAEIYAEPKFRFDITGFVHVEADLLIKTIELYDKRWELAAVEYGSGLRFGLKLPIHYEEGKPFNLSFSDVQFEYPDIDAGDVLKGLVKKVL